jgi:hypothetical protein
VIRLLALCLVLLVSACERSQPVQVPAVQDANGQDATGQAAIGQEASGSGPVCRIGPDGGPLVADRGIGGTGAPPASRLVERGIGGTGIVGVITGFASICLNGLEVAVDAATQIDIDGTAANVAALRVGQLAAVDATGPTDALHARHVSIRHEVSGPVEAMEIGSNALSVAGQRVVVPDNALGRGSVRLGDWASVSGLRAEDGTVVATRLDLIPPGIARLTGPLQQVDGSWRIGGVAIMPPLAGKLAAEPYAIATGQFRGGVLQDASVAPDTMMADPPVFFPGADRLVIESYARQDQGIVRFGSGFQAPVAAGSPQLSAKAEATVVWMNRTSDGHFSVGPVSVQDRARSTVSPASQMPVGRGGLQLPPAAGGPSAPSSSRTLAPGLSQPGTSPSALSPAGPLSSGLGTSGPPQSGSPQSGAPQSGAPQSGPGPSGSGPYGLPSSGSRPFGSPSFGPPQSGSFSSGPLPSGSLPSGSRPSGMTSPGLSPRTFPPANFPPSNLSPSGFPPAGFPPSGLPPSGMRLPSPAPRLPRPRRSRSRGRGVRRTP